MLEDYKRGLWRGRLQISIILAATSTFYLGSAMELVRHYGGARKTGELMILPQDVNGNGREDLSMVYKEGDKIMWRKYFLKKQDGSYNEFNEPNSLYRERDPNNSFRSPAEFRRNII